MRRDQYRVEEGKGRKNKNGEELKEEEEEEIDRKEERHKEDVSIIN